MAIQFYEKGELSSGFWGWRVVVMIRGERYQKYLSLRRPGTSVPEELWYRYQKTRAEYYEARWSMRAAATKYLDFIRTEHARTRPFRGVGFQGITLGIGTIGGSQTEQCYFQVNVPGNPVRIAISEEQTLSRAWDRAVVLWGETFGIRPKDIEARRHRSPAPEQFKRLRKHMNDEEQASLGVGVLHYVYAEQRAELERKKSRSSLRERRVEQEDLLDVHSRLEREISQFLEKSAARA
ncbi:hypothetical protein SAMN05216203_1780 [Marinobacter daqiaonensis]|uniref:Uncharacterized protein n=1 Tax=Marinobacter daqiaonensis TaxID=650891 RepID=A0A1I6I3L7_9GAMM|nr:hypothetical protein [Marinobacter daqiaonensis]SFR61249.1 hypothetical protein SAMN05216203_1780 [Marinobacter daqiaonensis]